jgi:hypothetical protein
MSDNKREPPASNASSAKADRDAIWEQRPDLKDKSLEAVKRIMRREARLSLKPRHAPGGAREREWRPRRMTRLILNRASASRSSGQWSENDFDVLADGKVIGRIYEDASASTPPELRWLRSVTAIVPAIPNRTNGHAPTLDEAKAKFRAA